MPDSIDTFIKSPAVGESSGDWWILLDHTAGRRGFDIWYLYQRYRYMKNSEAGGYIPFGRLPLRWLWPGYQALNADPPPC